jgi:anti-sigma B factor antagonist
MHTADTRDRSLDPFHCEVRRDGDTGSVRPVGELDLATVAHVEAELRALRDAGCPRVVLDLRGLSFMDSNGVRLAVAWDAAARGDGFTFAIVPGIEPVQRVFRLTGLEGRLPVAEV